MRALLIPRSGGTPWSDWLAGVLEPAGGLSVLETPVELDAGTLLIAHGDGCAAALRALVASETAVKGTILVGPQLPGDADLAAAKARGGRIEVLLAAGDAQGAPLRSALGAGISYVPDAGAFDAPQQPALQTALQYGYGVG